MSQRDIEDGLAQAVGQFVLSQRRVSEIAESVTEEDEAWRTRDWRAEPVAYLLIDTVSEPLRRWGQKTGVLWVGAIGEDGRKVLLSLSPTNRESCESCVEVLRDLLKRGLRPPVTITTAGAIGLTKAIAAIWPQSLRLRWWFHQMKTLEQKGPAQAWPAVKALVVDRRAAPSRQKAEERRAQLGAQYQREFPEACRCLLDEAEASRNPLEVPARHQH